VTLSWDAELLADTYNVYRGDVSSLTSGGQELGLFSAP
jgi:hypothetical protein